MLERIEGRDLRMVAYALFLQGNALLNRSAWLATQDAADRGIPANAAQACWHDGSRLLEIGKLLGGAEFWIFDRENSSPDGSPESHTSKETS